MWACFVFLLAASTAMAETFPLGKIVENVRCLIAGDQHYALYLPSNYSPQRKWPVLFLFDAGGRGQRGVERYQPAAEKYGYILAGSNNSRNGPWEVSAAAARAMTADVATRFAVDRARLYTGGMSGGARVAMTVALASSEIAGVFASSAAWPGEPQSSVSIPVFGSAGSDDFNHQEMRTLDQDLRSAHRVLYFTGWHEWLPAELATEGVEWMELQAMRAGKRPRDQAFLNELFAAHVARAEKDANPAEQFRLYTNLVADFQGLQPDVTAYAKRASELKNRKEVRAALDADQQEDRRETQSTNEVYRTRDRMTADLALRVTEFANLKRQLHDLARQANATEDTSERRIARRVLTGFVASSRQIRDEQFQALLEEVRLPQNRRE